jgi:hypothetical protein
MKLLSIFLAGTLLAGCATGAQLEGNRIDQVAADTASEAKQCENAVLLEARFSTLLPKLPPRDSRESPSMAILSNSNVPTAEEARLLIDLHDAMQPCRKKIIEGASRISPALVVVFAENYQQMDELYLRLVQRSISWGDFARSRQVIAADSTRKFAAVQQDIQQNLQVSHAQEMQQRQAAASTFLAWNAYQQQIQAQHSLVNAVNRPRMTQCHYAGVVLQCTTY